MIITDDLVMLNFPKTGSTFAREVFKRVYSGRESRLHKLLVKAGMANPCIQELLLPQIDEERNSGIKAQHGTLRQIPAEHRHKPIVSIMRNPFSRYVSLYLFRWWEKVPPAEKHSLLERYPHFPDLSFCEYYELEHLYGRKNRLHGIVPKMDLGGQSLQFIQFYFRDPESVLKKIDDEYIDKGRYREDMASIHFLHQEDLNRELKEFLVGIGMNRQALAFIDSMGKVNETEKKPGDGNDRDYYAGTALQDKILERDRLLFAIFPEYLSDNACAQPSQVSLRGVSDNL
jgi:hypothetical protein